MSCLPLIKYRRSHTFTAPSLLWPLCHVPGTQEVFMNERFLALVTFLDIETNNIKHRKHYKGVVLYKMRHIVVMGDLPGESKVPQLPES